jgi:GTP cyclohydrolase I
VSGTWDGTGEWYDWQIKEGVSQLIRRAGADRNSSHLADTPERFTRAWDFWTSGYQVDPASVIKMFGEEAPGQYDGMVFQANIPVWSLCAHHLAPFWGLAHVGYIPRAQVVGLSKLARVVDVFARRLQTQEALGNQIADTLLQHLRCRGVGVVLQCRHACMESRGVQKSGTLTITSVLRGELKGEADCRAEFMSLVNVAVQGAKGV